MANKAGLDVYLKLDVGGSNEIDLSPNLQTFSLPHSAGVVDGTCMGATSHVKHPLLKDWSISAKVLADFGAGLADSKLHAILGTKVDVECCPDGDTPSASNPKYSGECILESITPINVGLEEMASVDISIQGSGDLGRAES